MSDLVQVQVPLREGLDLFNPRLQAAPGSLLDCRNYESLDTVGYRRIDGFERFDGTPGIYTGTNYYLLSWSGNGLDQQFYDEEDAFAPGQKLFTEGAGFPCGTILASTHFAVGAWAITFSAIVAEDDPSFVQVDDDELISQDSILGNTARVTNSGDGGVISLTRLSYDDLILANPSLGATTSTIVADINESYLELRDEKTAFDWWDGGRAHALNWFDDRLYAVCDCEYVYLVSTGAVTDGNLYPGEIFTFDTASFRLMDYKVLEGSLNASGCIVKALVQRIGDIDLADEHGTAGGSTRATGNALTLYSTSVPTLSMGVDDPPVWGAALFHSTSAEQGSRTGWNPVDMGLEIDFTGGTGTPIAELSREFYETPVQAATPSTLESDATNVVLGTGSITAFASTSGGGTNYAADIAAADSAYIYVTATGGSPGGWTGGTDGLELLGFDVSALPEDCFITGIELKLRAGTYTSGGSAAIGNETSIPEMYISGFERLSTNRGSITTTVDGAYAEYTFGGANDLWGLGDLITRNSLVDALWGFRGRFLALDSMDANDRFRIDKAHFVIHYVPATSRIYIGDATNRVACDVVRIHVRSDDNPAVDTWSNATGTMHVYNITNDAGGTRSWIGAGDGIYLASSGGSAVASVAGTKGSMLPTLSEISAAGTRYQFANANFYAREDWESMYGVSGAGRAFAWDTKYFRKIYTEYDSTIDKPRHIEYYRNYLALGYATGSVLLSALTEDGPEPENFTGEDGSSFNFNDKVRGLLTLPDTSLGVFCEDSIHRLVLTPDGTLQQSAISPHSGIIEYTLAPLGQTAVFCDRRGIRSLEQVDAYGDFLGRPLSNALGSWLRNRLTTLRPYSSDESITSVVAAYSVRSKNQYRIWFRDGQQLTMTLLGPQEAPIFTKQLFSDASGYYVPIALSHGVDSLGRERLHFAHYAPWRSSTDALNTDTDKMYVFELDKGWHFDDNAITASATIAYNFLDNPVQSGTLKKVRLYGTSHGLGTLTVSTGSSFTDSISSQGVDISLPRTSDVGFLQDQRWYYNIAAVAERGLNLVLYFAHSPAEGEPSHTLQSLILDYLPGKVET